MDYIGIIVAVISVAGTLSGVVIGWIGRARQVKQDIQTEAAADTSLRVDVEYIKRGIDDIRADQRRDRQDIGALDQRVTRVEESAKQAHKRIDEIGGHRSA